MLGFNQSTVDRDNISEISALVLPNNQMLIIQNLLYNFQQNTFFD